MKDTRTRCPLTGKLILGPISKREKAAKDRLEYEETVAKAKKRQIEILMTVVDVAMSLDVPVEELVLEAKTLYYNSLS